jgi:hypothetical protein
MNKDHNKKILPESYKVALEKLKEQEKDLRKSKELDQIQKQVTSIQETYNTSNVHSHGIVYGGGPYTTTPTTGTYYPSVTSPGITPPQSHIVSPHTVPQMIIELDSDELSDLIEMLEVEPGGQGLLLRIKDVDYGLINILRAQVEMMVRLNIFLMHRLLPDDLPTE